MANVSKLITESRKAEKLNEFEVPFIDYMVKTQLNEEVDEFDAFTDQFLSESSKKVK